MFLREALQRVKTAGYELVNLDSTLILSAPRIGPLAEAIRKQVLSGTTLEKNVWDAGPRREALHRALSSLQSGDVLLVAGKGHEDYQIVLERDPSGRPICDSRGRPVTKKIPFSDATIIREIAASL